MHKITLENSFKIGEADVDAIEVSPLTFVELVDIWNDARNESDPGTALQRSRILKQTHFMAKGTRITAEEGDLMAMPAGLAKDIIAALDIDQGTAGKILPDTGDGTTSALIYQLGTPIKMQSGKEGGPPLTITELEFFAKTYGELEKVLAEDNEMTRAVALLKTVAKPLGIDVLKTLPLWAIDKMTVADGVTIMRKVSPAF